MKLDQIEGARTLAAVWVVLHHVLVVDSLYDERRGGFITHWVYGRPQRWDGDLIKFYANRLDRVLLTGTLTVLTYWALGKITGVSSQFPLIGDMGALTAPQLLSCLTYVHWYIEPDDLWRCPNDPAWTIGALIPSWLLYPLYRRLLTVAAERGGTATTAALLLLAAGWAVTFGVLLAIYASEGFEFTERQSMYLYEFPPAQLDAFMLGVAGAAVALRATTDAPAPGEEAPLNAPVKEGAKSQRAKAWGVCWAREPWVGLLADGAALSVVCLVVLLPLVGGSHLKGWDPLLDHAFAPLLALWCAAPSAVPLFALRPASHRIPFPVPGCSPPQSGALPRPAESRECCANQRWPVRASTPSTCTCCTRS